MTPRSRNKQHLWEHWSEWDTGYPGGAPRVQGITNLRSIEALLKSSGHAFHKLGKTNLDIGGEFYVTQHYYSDNSQEIPEEFSNVAGNPQASGRHFSGKQFARFDNATTSAFPVPTMISDAQLDALGTTAIANVIPTNPHFDLATFAGELREGIPRLCGSDFFRGRTDRLRKAGGEYLNVEFGWKPLLSDIRSFTSSVKNSDEFITNFVNHSGIRVKRKFAFPIETAQGSSKTSTNWYPVPQISYAPMVSAQPRYLTSIRTHERWFEGCFTYYVPPYKVNGDNTKRNAQLRYHLFGTRVTPEVIWNLTPWSWAIDWFGNTGDILHNLAAFQNDGLVMPYGYMMEKTIQHDIHELHGVTYKSYPGVKYHLVQTLTTEVKRRRAATPYGFGLNLATLSSRQWSILGALGLTRSHRQF